MTSEIIIQCSEAIAAKSWNIAFAESASGGELSAEFSLTPLLGKILRGAVLSGMKFLLKSRYFWSRMNL
ncbi:hypothetical protein [Flavobacterium sp. MEB061]|uniref:hypothetical protein n=1 Tax=Flavobacterium sp. MEB061 TaxID=1587524 RepID=UPI001A953241|nr:hypothetical protein [Flavobacterium sp. MEB061]